MPRKGPAPKRPIIIDPVYQAPIVTQLINKVLLDGKRFAPAVLVARPTRYQLKLRLAVQPRSHFVG